MTTEIQELPEVGEIVIATVSKVSDHGAYVTLDEYNNIQGFLHVSEIAPGWVRNISRYVKEGEKKVLLVKRYEKGRTIIQSVKEAADLSQKEVEKLEEVIFSKYDSIYDAFLDVVRKGIIVSAQDFKAAEKTLKPIVLDIQESIEKQKGTFNFVREESKKTREG